MDKKKPTAKLKKKGTYLPASDPQDAIAPEAEVQQSSPAPPIKTATYGRRAHHHWLRMLALLALAFMDVSIVSLELRNYFLLHIVFTGKALLHRITLYIIFIFLNITILPSIVLEANRVEISDERITFRNLLFSQSVKWSEITSVVTPFYLKCAIVRWPGWFQLINKRDILDFDQLLQTIKTKTGLPAK